jgi:hypothetical protein
MTPCKYSRQRYLPIILPLGRHGWFHFLFPTNDTTLWPDRQIQPQAAHSRKGLASSTGVGQSADGGTNLDPNPSY